MYKKIQSNTSTTLTHYSSLIHVTACSSFSSATTLNSSSSSNSPSSSPSSPLVSPNIVNHTINLLKCLIVCPITKILAILNRIRLLCVLFTSNVCFFLLNGRMQMQNLNSPSQPLAPLSLLSSSSLLSSQSSSMSCYQYNSAPCQLLSQTSTSLIISSPSFIIIQLDDTNSNCHRQQSRRQSSAENIMNKENAHHSDDNCDYRRLLVQLEETERRFDEFWNIHLSRLKQCLELRRFEQDFRELQVSSIKCIS